MSNKKMMQLAVTILTSCSCCVACFMGGTAFGDENPAEVLDSFTQHVQQIETLDAQGQKE